MSDSCEHDNERQNSIAGRKFSDR